MFDSLPVQDARPIAFLKRAIAALLALCAVSAADSGYRAYVQVRSLDLHLSSPVLRSGSVVEVAVVTSGRTCVDVRVELVQGSLAQPLATEHVHGNDWASLDPRSPRAFRRVVITPAALARFSAGEAQVRATAVGRPQWLRLPPPTVRARAVEVRHE